MANVKYQQVQREFYFGGCGPLKVVVTWADCETVEWGSRVMNVSPRYIEEAVKAFRRWIASVQQQTRRGIGVQGIRLVACAPDGSELVPLASFGITEPTVYGSKTTLQVSVPIVEKDARQMTIDEHLANDKKSERPSASSMGDMGPVEPTEHWENEGGSVESAVVAPSRTQSEDSKPKTKLVRGAGGRFQKVPIDV